MGGDGTAEGSWAPSAPAPCLTRATRSCALEAKNNAAPKFPPLSCSSALASDSSLRASTEAWVLSSARRPARRAPAAAGRGGSRSNFTPPVAQEASGHTSASVARTPGKRDRLTARSLAGSRRAATRPPGPWPGREEAGERGRYKIAARARMTLISISGACSRAGKTAAAVSLLRALPAGRAAAVKFTTTEDVFERCPRGTTCIVCDIDVPFRIVDDPAVLDEAGTDTARLRAAGAARVVWAIARGSAVVAAWAAVQPRLGGADVVVMEGSTITAVARPHRPVFVA